jgi:hypothetical protein
MDSSQIYKAQTRWGASTADLTQYEITTESTKHSLHTCTGATDQTEHIHKQEQYKIKQNTIKKYSFLKF